MPKFEKGQSGNPGGRPKEVAGVRELARQHTPDAVATLVAIMQNEDAPPAARVSAANSLLDRGYGRPNQAVSVSTDTGISERLAAAERRMLEASRTSDTMFPHAIIEDVQGSHEYGD